MNGGMGFKFWLKLSAVGVALAGLTAFMVMNLALKGGEVTLPDLTGRSFNAAASDLRQSGLTLKMEDERYSGQVLKGCIVSQEIAGGTRIKRGRTVYVVVSKGSAKVSIPDLSGLSLRQAQILLQQNGLEAAETLRLPAAAPAETVMAQFPEPGATRGQGAAVSLLVSSGPEVDRWVMPNLEGRGLDLARAACDAMGLVLRDVKQEDRSGAAAGAVLDQSLEAGAEVARGAELTLVVARGREDIAKARLGQVHYEVPADGRAERRVRVLVKDTSGQRVVYNNMEKPGAKVDVSVRVYGAARYTVQLGGADVLEGDIQ